MMAKRSPNGCQKLERRKRSKDNHKGVSFDNTYYVVEKKVLNMEEIDP